MAVRAAAVARAAADDTGAGHAAIADVDAWVHVVAWDATNPTELIAQICGSRVRHHYSSGNGGEVGVVTANWAARSIMAGELSSVMVTGGADYRTEARAARLGVPYTRPRGGDGAFTQLVSGKRASTDIEIAHGMAMPIQIYPIFENALRAKRGRTIEEHRVEIWALMSSFTEVAATNPHAWFPRRRTGDELTLPSAQNRMIGFPYTKQLNAILDVDLNAAYLMMSVERARRLGISEDKFVYWWGGDSADEVAYFASERPNLAACPSMQRAHRAGLREAGIGIDDVAFIDFYSCFPVAVEMACEMLGVDERDPRRLTLTGGLPYAGGPGSAYPLHSLAAMVERVREQPTERAFVSGNGMWLSKHASSVWSGRPKPASAVGNPPPAGTDHPEAPIPVAVRPDGDGVIEGYTVLHDRAGDPALGIVIGRLDNGERFVANVREVDQLVALETAEGVGRRGKVRAGEPTNTFDLL